MISSFTLGQVARITGTFRNKDGDLIDPTAVILKIKDPAGTVDTYTYNVEAELVKDSLGIYHLDLDCDPVGWWAWRFYSTGTGQAALEGRLWVHQSEFD